MSERSTYDQNGAPSQDAPTSLPSSDQPSVTLVIPGRNCASTLDRCLSSVVPLKESGQLTEIVFVDDGSTDETPHIAARYPVTVLTGKGQGPGAARNLGWRATECELIWFIDSDCVAEPDALEKLLPHLNDPEVAGVGGSYANLYPESLVASLIHEEIVARHRRMRREVNFLATFNVIYRRSVLSALSGYNEELKLAQDAEFAYRVIANHHRLNFEIDSRVGHHHPRNLWRYLRTQTRQGYYRIKLYREHPAKVSGDSYAGIVDYLQPILSAGSLISLPCLFLPWGWILLACCTMGVFLLQIPLTAKLLDQAGVKMFAFPAFGFVRSYARALGMLAGVCLSRPKAGRHKMAIEGKEPKVEETRNYAEPVS